MKKFYYSKESSQDESPIVFPGERHNTMDVNNGQGMSARAASVNSLNLLSEAPIIPRIKTRDVTRSMSDVATKAQAKKQKLFTETELSSSWLYKTMQASINARFKSPRKSPCVQKGDFDQSILRDPELKPIPIKSKAAKTSSCICHFATMIAISLCTIGFLASIAAIIYMEIFTDRNITSLHTTEAEVDLSDVVMNSREAYNLTTHRVDGEEHILNEALTHRFDGDEEILNEVLKVSPTNDTFALFNETQSYEQFPDEVADNMPETLELDKINDENSKIKFQDDITTIYEMKPEEPIENDINSDLSLEFKGRSFGLDHRPTENNSENFEKSTENIVKDNLKQDIGIYTESDGMLLNESAKDNAEGTDKSYNVTLNENKFKENLKETFMEDELKLRNAQLNEPEKNKSTDQIVPDGFLTSKSSEIIQSQDLIKTPNSGTNDVLQSNDRIDHSDESDKGDTTQLSMNLDAISINLSDFQTEKYNDEVFRSTLKGENQTVDDHDVNTMLVTVDDIEASTDSFLSKRNGEIFQVSSPVPIIESVKQITEDSSIPPKKPVNIKASLSDAMKHLQKLDVNNKLLTSRSKPKQKANVKKPKLKAVSNKEERKRYLQHMRLMLFKTLQ